MIDTKRLRQKILDLAIRGKLVPQDPTDEPASVLLERIRKEKQQMVADGKLKKKDVAKDSIIFFGDDSCPYEKVGDAEPVCIADEVPFELPDGWEWARIESFATVLNGDRGKNYPAKSKLSHVGIPFVSALNISNGIVSDEKMLYMTDEQYDALGAGKLEQNDIVFCIRGSLGKCGVFPYAKGAIASSLIIVRSVLRDPVLSWYLLYLLQAELTYWHMGRFDNGTAQPNLAAKDFKAFLYPIPPLAEQQRIVAALDEYLALVDEIERNQEQLEELLAKARSKVLDLAIRGKLVPQDPTDEPASVLLERIREEKLQMVADGKLKKKDIARDSVIFKGEDNSYYERFADGKDEQIEDELFDVPIGWSWAKLGTVSIVGSGSTPNGNLINDVEGIPYFKVADMNVPGNELRMEIVSQYVSHNYTSDIVGPGSIIFPKNGGAVLTNKRRQITCPCVVDLNTGFCSPILLSMQSWLWLLLNQIDFGALYKGSAVPTVNATTIKNILVPIAPDGEQQRIVAALDEYLPLLSTM